ncbi:MAG: molybdopterin cofactor-binding domain-containing protein, partial [Bacteroidota bacterium]
MKKTNSNYNRRDFLKISSLAGGGILLSISWMAQAKAEALTSAPIQEMWQELNGFIQITPDNIVKIFSPNPEFGTNVLTSLPMLVAEELEADWEKVVVEQGNYDTPRFVRQFTGGSNAMAAAWIPLRTAGATARLMLLQAAANSWNVPVSELRAEKGFVYHDISQRK